METMISIVLLIKSLFKREFTWLDIAVAEAVRNEMNLIGAAPAWLEMIANLTAETILPEAWADFTFDLKTGLFSGNDHQDKCGGE